MPAFTSTVYEVMEDAVADALSGDETPFKYVQAYGTHLADAELGRELDRLSTLAPAALVYFAGSETNGGNGGQLIEVAKVAVLVVAAGRSAQAAGRGDAQSAGLYHLMVYARNAIHNAQLDTLIEPMLYMGSKRYSLPSGQVAVGAMEMLFTARLIWPDGPTSTEI